MSSSLLYHSRYHKTKRKWRFYLYKSLDSCLSRLQSLKQCKSSNSFYFFTKYTEEKNVWADSSWEPCGTTQTQGTKKDGMVIMSLNLALGPECGDSCIGVYDRNIKKQTKTWLIYVVWLPMKKCLQKVKEHTSESVSLHASAIGFNTTSVTVWPQSKIQWRNDPSSFLVSLYKTTACRQLYVVLMALIAVTRFELWSSAVVGSKRKSNRRQEASAIGGFLEERSELKENKSLRGGALPFHSEQTCINKWRS